MDQMIGSSLSIQGNQAMLDLAESEAKFIERIKEPLGSFEQNRRFAGYATLTFPRLRLALVLQWSYPANRRSEVCAELIKKFRRSVCHSPQLSVGFLTHRQ